MTARKCPHGLKDWSCTTCCLRDLWDRLDDLDRAVTAQRTSGGGSEFVTGGARSWEPISLSALALRQDIRKAGGLRQVEQTIGRGPTRLVLTVRLNRWTWHDPHADLERTVRRWRSRARLILGEALAPYPLLWTDVLTVDRNRWTWHNPQARCPVVDEHGTCGGGLLVHYDDDPGSGGFSKIGSIGCQRDDTHEWTSGLGFMRLGRIFGGRSGAAA